MGVKEDTESELGLVSDAIDGRSPLRLKTNDEDFTTRLKRAADETDIDGYRDTSNRTAFDWEYDEFQRAMRGEFGEDHKQEVRKRWQQEIVRWITGLPESGYGELGPKVRPSRVREILVNTGIPEQYVDELMASAPSSFPYANKRRIKWGDYFEPWGEFGKNNGVYRQ